MKIYIILIIIFLQIHARSIAGDGDKFLNIGGGYQTNAIKWNTNIANLVIGYEMEGKHHNSWEIYFDFSTAYRKCPLCKEICTQSFFDYKTFGLGVAYKPAFIRGRNSLLRWRIGGDLGSNKRGFQCSFDFGLEYSYSFKNRMQIYIMQKNDLVFWSRDHFRNGFVVGFKLPLNTF